jgi:hypothetical protein
MQEFYDEKNLPTATEARIQDAAISLGFLLAQLGKEIPEFVTKAAGDKFTTDIAVEDLLYKELNELITNEPAKANELLDGDTTTSKGLLTWWTEFHASKRDYSVEALRLAKKLANADGNVDVYHESGVCTHWLTRGTQSWPDPDSRTNELRIPLNKLAVRTGEDAGGAYTYLTYPSNANFHNIVRAVNGRLVAGETKRPSWMY